MSLPPFVRNHPRWVWFVALAVVMVGILLVASRDVVLEPMQRGTLVASTVLLAGLSVWIIHWE